MVSPGSIFLIAVLYSPTEAERINGVKKRVLVEPKFVLADDVQSAVNKAIISVPTETPALDPDRFEVFAKNPF